MEDWLIVCDDELRFTVNDDKFQVYNYVDEYFQTKLRYDKLPVVTNIRSYFSFHNCFNENFVPCEIEICLSCDKNDGECDCKTTSFEESLKESDGYYVKITSDNDACLVYELYKVVSENTGWIFSNEIHKHKIISTVKQYPLKTHGQLHNSIKSKYTKSIRQLLGKIEITTGKENKIKGVCEIFDALSTTEGKLFTNKYGRFNKTCFNKLKELTFEDDFPEEKAKQYFYDIWGRDIEDIRTDVKLIK